MFHILQRVSKVSRRLTLISVAFPVGASNKAREYDVNPRQGTKGMGASV